MIRSAVPDDAKAIVDIYNHYIEYSHATFEMTTISTEEMINRIRRVQVDFKLPWLVTELEDQVIGYAYASQWKPRVAYAKTAESSIYLNKDHGGKGLGMPLYYRLMKELKDFGYHAIIGGMALPNEASCTLHEKLGFQKIGEFKEVGYKFDRWINVGYWELIL
ncbi:GNAT family N-acetyltransferase [Ekhidna sp.]|uniref:GNAT family N-acetyltransferase n=1 Tax=Ekhidna sp. TaxID=2608089 RepID=UPI003B506A91